MPPASPACGSRSIAQCERTPRVNSPRCRTRAHTRRGAAFHAARDEDRRAFNHRFGTALLTETAARERLQALKARVPAGYRDYAPIDFGGGLTVGQIYSTDSGTGRWEFFNRHIVGPLIDDKRVVDLGANNASMSLMMARAGAREVVAVEESPAIAEFARLNAGIFSWREMRKLNIDVRTGDMRIFLYEDLGRFDVVTAFCSLYYLPEEDMARVIRRAAGMGATRSSCRRTRRSTTCRRAPRGSRT